MDQQVPKKRHAAGMIRYHLSEIEEWAKQGFTRLQIYENLQSKGVVITYSSFITALKRARKRAAKESPSTSVTGKQTPFASGERNLTTPTGATPPAPDLPEKSDKLDLRAVLRGEIQDIEKTVRPSIRRNK